MPRIVLNRRFASVFDLSHEGWTLYSGLKGHRLFAKDNGPKAVRRFSYYKSPDFIEAERLRAFHLDRTDPSLVETVERLGSGAAAGEAELEVVELPAGANWCRHGYDGYEWIVAMGRVW